MDAECRTCLEISDNVLDIFGDRLHKKIATISSLEISPNDGFPTKICKDCVRIVHLLHNFRTQIIKSRETREESADLLGTECRTCLKIVEDKKYLDVLSDGLPHKIETISSVKVSPDDYFSKYICAKCARKVEFLYRFRNTIISSWNILVERRQGKIKGTEEILDEAPVVIKNVIEKPTVIVKRTIHLCKCLKCDFLTPSYFAWKQHIRMHEEKTNQTSLCEFCGKVLDDVRFFSHVAWHTASLKQKKVECPQCGSVIQSLKLNAHMLRHRRANNPPKKCSVCELRFHDSAGLKRHMRSHTGERPYICKICSKGFSSTNALKTHIRQHTQEEPYTCDYCDASFKQAVLVRRHLKSKHPEKVVEKSSS